MLRRNIAIRHRLAGNHTANQYGCNPKIFKLGKALIHLQFAQDGVRARILYDALGY